MSNAKQKMDTLTKSGSITKEKKEKNFSFLSLMQNIGKSLVFPIATLPAAALLLRLGVFIQTFGNVSGNGGEQFAYWLGFIMSTPGAAVFDNMPIIFGIGVAFGFAKENRGEVALIGAIAYFALIGLAQNEGSLTSMIYSTVNLGNGMNASNGVFHSDLLYLNIDSGTLDDNGGLINTSLDNIADVSVWLMNFGVFGGILTGLTSAVLYNKFADIRLHPSLGFFSGRRFVPIITLFIMIGVSFAMAVIWPWVNFVLILFSKEIDHIPAIGASLYAFANRLLIPFGLHQVLNTYFWFQSPVVADLATIGETGMASVLLQDSEGVFKPVLGDINAFSDITSGSVWMINGLKYTLTFDSLGINAQFIAEGSTKNSIDLLQSANIGMYQAGFYPTMMFGLPAVAIAMAVRSENEHKKAVWAFMIAGSLVAFLTGITEPLEFAFMFISPVIYVTYAALSALWAFLVVVAGASNGFGFSAGLIDWIISLLGGGTAVLSKWGIFSNLWVIAVGVIAAAVNFTVVYFLINVFDIATPGRNGNLTGLTNNDENEVSPAGPKGASPKVMKMAQKTIDFIGVENIEKVDNCITRVRLTVKNNSAYDDEAVKKIGYSGVVKVGKKAYQMIIGPESEAIANEMTRLIAEGYGK